MTSLTSNESPQQDNSSTSSDDKRNIPNFIIRLITGLVLLPIVVFVILYGGWVFSLFIGTMITLSTIEFYFIERHHGAQNNVIIGVAAAVAVILSFHTKTAWIWQAAVIIAAVLTLLIEYGRSRDFINSVQRLGTTLGGIAYIAFPGAFCIAIRNMHPFGIHWMFVVIFCVWSVDTFSYIFGNMLGKTPLAPKLSPKKTREGAAAGIIFGAVLPMLLLLRIDELTISAALMLLVAPFIAIVGDLFESGMKRYFGVKDSGIRGFNPFPGHGGVLDRIDAMLWVTAFVYGYLVVVGNVTLLI